MLDKKINIPWLYHGTVVDYVPEGAAGFIYHLYFDNGMEYVGKKAFFHTITKPPLKGKKRKRKVQKCSGWPHYIGSIKNEQFNKDYKAGKIKLIRREIIKICAKNLNYEETKALFEHQVLEDPKYYNTNILGRYYRNNLNTE